MAEKKMKEMKELKIPENPSGIKGTITLSEDVVSTIAGLAAREVDGIHSIGKSSIFQFGDDPKRGMHTEVGSIQAAFDIDVVVEYGKDVRKVVQELREKIAKAVNTMTGREVIEININIIDIKVPERKEKKQEPRV